ncbi:hypothetical protein ABTY96_03330 [Streptomyces sp. NPDC096057]|uniref:hypothetical protein n=1 Tax=Streptomyces sp. NPDC096057 TaxID=3155543 RepID=UPI0033202CD1
MSTLEETLQAAERHIDYSGTDGVPHDVYLLLQALVGDVQALTEGTKRRQATDAVGMSRSDALTAAREHVEAMSTNGRGYQDGIKLSDKVAAVDRFARFLMGETE